MKMHTIAGAQILGRVEFPYPVVPVVRHHHERWDGKGYPDGLSGEDIPLTARILSVVDCFDAVREDRQYRKGMTREEAIEFIMNNSGSLYDPQVVGTFITHLPEFEAEIRAHKAAPTFGIEPVEQLSEAAREVAPATGFAEVVAIDAGAAKEDFALDELRALYGLVQSLQSMRSRDEIAASFLEKLSSLISYDTCAVTLADAESGNYEIMHGAGQHAASLVGRRVMPGEGVAGWVLANRHPFCNTDPRLDLPPALLEQFSSYRTLAVFPIIKGKEIFGTVALYSCTLGEYDAKRQRLMSEAVGLFALALSAIPETAITAANAQTEIKDQAAPGFPVSRNAALSAISHLQPREPTL
jgi:hypothetical protein